MPDGLRLDAALPREVFGPRVTIGIEIGACERKSNGRLSFQGRPLLDRLNSFGKFDGRSIHTACMFGTGRAHVAQAYRRGSTDASLVPVCGNFAQGYRRSSRRRSSSGQ